MLESKLNLDFKLVEQARAHAARVADDTQRFIDGCTTVAVERTICRLLGIDGVDASDVPLPSVVVDHLMDKGALPQGAAFWIGNAMVETGKGPQAIAEDVAADKLELTELPVHSEADIHTITASQVFNMPSELVTPLMRSRAKAVNFGIVYGIGAFSLAKDIGVTRKEADQYIKGYLAHYAGVQRYMDRVVKQAKEQGYVSTLFGRRRYLPELTASNANLRAFGERVARNMPIQGTAADIIKIAMVKVDERLRRENLRARLIMQVHDELIVEAPEKEAQRAARILNEEMEGACKMRVRLKADVHQGKTWYDAKG